jgi:hypothetical protein
MVGSTLISATGDTLGYPLSTVLGDELDKGTDDDIEDGSSVGRILDNEDIKLGSAVFDDVTGYCEGNCD